MFVNMPATVEGTKLQLTKEQEERCRVVYRKTKDEKGAYFEDLWNPDMSYADEFIIVPLKSIYGGVTDILPVGKNFANVAGSTNDPKPPGYKYWIDFLRYNQDLKGLDVKSCCAELDIIYKGNSQDEIVKDTEGFRCGGNTVGGHVILDATNSSTVVSDGTGTVHLLPICNHHNIFNYGNERSGKGYYMKLNREMRAVILNNYFTLPELVEV